MTDHTTPTLPTLLDEPGMSLELWVRDTGERVVSTFLQYALLWLLAMPATGAGVIRSLVAACLPPVIVVLMSALPGLTYRGILWWADALCRIARSGAQGALGALMVTGPLDLVHVTAWQTAALAAGGALLTALKSEIARHLSNTLTPASLHRLIAFHPTTTTTPKG
jgi:hypothetical protein